MSEKRNNLLVVLSEPSDKAFEALRKEHSSERCYELNSTTMVVNVEKMTLTQHVANFVAKTFDDADGDDGCDKGVIVFDPEFYGGQWNRVFWEWTRKSGGDT